MNNLAEQLSRTLVVEKKQKIVVVEFQGLTENTIEIGRLISEELVARLFRTGRFSMVERHLLDKVLEEQKLGLSGIIDENTAKKVGRLLGADAICTGTVTYLTRSVRVNARLISTETGVIFSAASAEVFKDEGIRTLTRKGNSYLNNNGTYTSRTNQKRVSKIRSIRTLNSVLSEHSIRFYPNGVSVILSLPSLHYKSVRPKSSLNVFFA